jgi:hypothetical protein
MKAYKVFNSDWTCRGFQYQVGETYEEKVNPSVCDRGFHFCKKLADDLDVSSLYNEPIGECPYMMMAEMEKAKNPTYGTIIKEV